MKQPEVKINGEVFEVVHLSFYEGDLTGVTYLKDEEEIEVVHYNRHQEYWYYSSALTCNVELIEGEVLQHA